MSGPYSLRVNPKLNRKLEKLLRKNPARYDLVLEKANELLENPHHYKNLRAPMQRFKRVHVDRSFVLLFSVNDQERTVTLEDFDHHDRIYKG